MKRMSKKTVSFLLAAMMVLSSTVLGLTDVANYAQATETEQTPDSKYEDNYYFEEVETTTETTTVEPTTQSPSEGDGTILPGGAVIVPGGGNQAIAPGIQVARFLVEGNQLSNAYLSLYVRPDKGLFTLGTTGGNPDSSTDNNKILLYRWPNSFTSRTTVVVDGAVNVYGQNGFVKSPVFSAANGNNISVAKYGDIEVKQVLSIVNNNSTDREDVLEVKYVVTNTGSISHTYGTRIMFDTMLGDNDSAPFRVPDVGAVTTQTEFAGENIPQYWQAFDNLSDPTVIAQGSFLRSSNRPDKVQLTNYSQVSGTLWNCSVTPGASNGDSAVTVIWNEKTLEPGETREYVTHYGLSEFTQATNGTLSTSLSCDSSISIVDGLYSPNLTTVTAYIQNTGGAAVRNAYISLSTSSDALTVDGASPAYIYLGTINPGEIVQKSWNLNVNGTLSDSTQTVIAKFGGDGLDEGTVTRNIRIPGNLTKIEVETLPDKTEYFVGESLDRTGLTLTASYANGTTETVTSGFTCTPTALNIEGTQTITVTYGEKTCTFDVTVSNVHVHSYTEYRKVPSCCDYGYVFYLCSCGYHYMELLPKTDHSWELISSSDATCTETGYEVYKCEYEGCGKTKTVEIPVKGHNFPANGVEYIEPTCTEDGYWILICLDCGAEQIKVNEGSKTGHNFGDGEIVKAPTCTESGIMRYTCACGYIYDVTVPPAHTAMNDGVVTTEPTCTLPGVITYSCTECGEGYTEEIPATGHDLSYVDNGNGTHTASCSECDYEIIEDHILKGRKCVCGYTDTAVISVLLIQDNAPWATTSNEDLLDEFKEENYIDSWEKCTSSQAIERDLEAYTIIVFANDQNTSAYENLGRMKTKLEEYISNGGVFILGACDEGWGGSGSLTQTLPFGIQTFNLYDYNNRIVDADHPIVTGELTEGRNLADGDLYHSYCSHTYFDIATLPADTNVIFKGSNNQPTLIEFEQGDGQIIVSGLTWEHNMVYRQTYAPIAFDDLLAYAINLSGFGDARYTVRFIDWNGDVLKTERVAYGEAAVAPSNPEREGYTFSGWDKAFDSVTESMEVTALYNVNEYTVALEFDASKGVASGSGTYEYGSGVILEAIAIGGYNFVGWYEGDTLLSNESLYVYTVPARDVTITARFASNVPVLSDIGVNTMPDKTSYFRGEGLDTEGFTLLATYSDGSTAVIDRGFICTPTVFENAGIQTITVTYGGKSCTFNVTVNDVAVVSISIGSLPIKTEYVVGDTLNTTGLTLTATYNNGTTETITSGFTCTPTALNTAGTQTITVTYGGKNCIFDVTVKSIELVRIKVSREPNKTDYYVGDTLDTTGLELVLYYSNGTTAGANTGYICNPTYLGRAGTQIITVTYQGFNDTFEVEVMEEEITVPSDPRPTEPSTGPTEPSTKPTEPTTRPTEPTTRPTEPTTKPTEPTTRPTEPTTRPTEPTTRPTEPTTKPTEPTTRPTEPSTRPTEPTTRPTEPTTKPEEPTTKPPVTEPEKPIEIKTPSVTVIRYGDSINLHAKLGRDVGLPEGYYIKWTVNNDNFRVVSTSLDNMSCNITPENNGDSEITVTVYDYNGGVICSDSQTMTAKAGFFQKIFGFLRRIFGLNKEIPALIRKYF